MHFFSVRLKFCLVFRCSLPFGLTDDSKASSPAAYPHLSPVPPDDLSYVTIVLTDASPTLHSTQEPRCHPRRKSYHRTGERLRRVVLRN
jgi:hypothetical protein